MEIAAKIFFTILLIALGGLILLVDPKANSAGPSSFWRLGERDPMRRLFFRPDGSFRRHARWSIFGIFAVALLLIWTVIPGN